jgi:hypothetical protein
MLFSRANKVALGTKENRQFQKFPVARLWSKYIDMLRVENKMERETEGWDYTANTL